LAPNLNIIGQQQMSVSKYGSVQNYLYFWLL